MRIGELAAQADVRVETIRYYQRRGLLREPEREFGRTRSYTRGDVERVRFIKAAQRMGFTLEEVAGLLRLDDGTHCSEAQVVAEQKLFLVRQRIRDLRRVEHLLAALVAECRAARGRVRCPLISALQSTDPEGFALPSSQSGE